MTAPSRGWRTRIFPSSPCSTTPRPAPARKITSTCLIGLWTSWRRAGVTDKPRKVLIIGSGPIVIGQAAEFDYAGTQACKAMREEGVLSVLVNSNSSTIMTDTDVADAVYIEPLTVPVVERVIARERPDGLLPTLGGQTGLNLAKDLADAGILDKYSVRLLGTPLEAIKRAEDREL